MTEHSYSCEFKNGYQAILTIADDRPIADVHWTPDIPHKLKGKARRRFLATYRAWRDECLADFARRTGASITVLDV